MNKVAAIGLALSLFVFTACEDDTDSPQNPASFKTKVALKIQVGDIVYDNLNSKITVEALNSQEETVWSKEFDYTGGEENVLDIPATSELYRLRVSQWGKTMVHLLTQEQLFEGRADGPAPQTVLFSGLGTFSKLKSSTRFLDEDVNGVTERMPQAQDQYEYLAGKLSRINAYEYNADAELFEFKRYFIAEYEDNRIAKLKGFLAGTDNQFNETSYTYLPDGRLSKIEERTVPAGSVNKATLVYSDEQPGLVTVTYQAFNGNSFIYSFNYTGNNIISEEIRKGGQVCSNGTRVYDKQINPFKHLGYTDFMLSNYSINNEVDEDITYKACSFPDLTIVSHSYVYLDNGYPFSKETTYSNGKKGEERYSYYAE